MNILYSTLRQQELNLSEKAKPGISQCILCKKSGLKKLYENTIRTDHSYDVYKCSDCGLAVTMPFPDKHQLSALYSSVNYRAHGKRFVSPVESAIHYFNNLKLQKLKAYYSGGRILDIGCGRGLMLWMAKKAGWDTFGLEFNDDSAYHAREVLGLDIRTGSVHDANLEYGTFDAITIWHVLEHLEDPVDVIRECHKLLKPGGLLALSVPNSASLQAKMSGRHWFHLDVPYHIYHFSLQNIKMLLKMNSFKVDKTSHFSFEQNPFGFLQSMLNASGITHNFFYNILKTRKLKTGSRDKLYFKDLLLTMILLPLYLPLAIVLSIIESLSGRGGTVEVFAIKVKQ